MVKAPSLTEEVKYFYRWLAGENGFLEEDILKSYVEAHAILPLQSATLLQVDTLSLMSLRLDPLALEFYLRRRHPQNSLSAKLKILTFLLEASPQTWTAFSPEIVGFVPALYRCASATLLSLLHYARGWRLARKLRYV